MIVLLCIILYRLFVCLLMVFNATFNNISVISWRSVLLAEETGVPGENHRPVGSHWQTLSHNVVSSTPLHELWIQLPCDHDHGGPLDVWKTVYIKYLLHVILTIHRLSVIGLMLNSATNPSSWYMCSIRLSIC